MPQHQPIMLTEVMSCLRPVPGEVAVDCTIGGGGHARSIVERLRPGGRLIGLDVDRTELLRTERSLRVAGFGRDTFTSHHANFSALTDVLATEGLTAVDVVFVDLGISAMQADDGTRGFHYKVPGPLDMRMDPDRTETAAAFLERVTEEELASVLNRYADEPDAMLIAALIKEHRPLTTQALERTVRLGLGAALPGLSKPRLKMAVRRTFQAVRIAVNDEFHALESLLAQLPNVMNPGARAAFLTFHSGEDRRVKQALRRGLATGHYGAIARTVIRSSMAETRANRRSSSAKLRWAVRS